MDPSDRIELQQDYSALRQQIRELDKDYETPFEQRWETEQALIDQFARKYGIERGYRFPRLRDSESHLVSTEMGGLAAINHMARDCMCHATRFVDKIYGVDRWTADPDQPISMSEARWGDLVHYNPGIASHWGVVIDPKRGIVQSAWGVGGLVFNHPIDVHVYPDDEVFIYRVRETS